MSKAIQKTTEPATPTTLLELAIQKGVDTVQLEKLMELQERWEKKEAKKKFFEALSVFQSKVPILNKNKTANIRSEKGSFSYKYSDLGNIGNKIKTVLLECGLSYRWEFKPNAGKMEVTCLLSHKDGHTETTSMEASLDNSGSKNAIQQIGSTHTYLQRYTLIGALGLTTADQDNDGKGTPEAEQDQTEEEILQQWQDLINQTKTKVELTSLYLKNKKNVDKQPKVQAMFKTKEQEYKTLDKVPTMQLP